MNRSEESNEVCVDDSKMLSSILELGSNAGSGWCIESLLSNFLIDEMKCEMMLDEGWNLEIPWCENEDRLESEGELLKWFFEVDDESKEDEVENELESMLGEMLDLESS